MIQHAKEDTLAQIFAIIDQIWIAQNNKAFNNEDTSIQTILRHASNSVNGYENANKNNSTRKGNTLKLIKKLHNFNPLKLKKLIG